MLKDINTYEPYKLKQIAARIWQSDGNFIQHQGFVFPVRMFLIQLQNNDFMIVSPIQLDLKLMDEVKFTMGIRKLLYIVSGSSTHNLFLEDWVNAFPGVELAGPQDLIDKMRKNKQELRFKYVLNNQLKVAWQNELEHVLIEGNKWGTEVLFYHKLSRSMIVTDLIQNHDLNLDHYKNKLFYKLTGIDSQSGGGCRKMYIMGFKWPLGDLEKAKAKLRLGLYWDFNKILIMHGCHILEDAKEYYIDFIKNL